MKINEEEVLRDVRRAYVLAKALNTQYVWIREFVGPSFKKPISDAKAANSYFIKQIDELFKKHKVSRDFIDQEEEISFKVLEALEQFEKTNINLNNEY